MDVKSQKLEQMKKKWVETNPEKDLYYRHKELLIAFFFQRHIHTTTVSTSFVQYITS